MTTPMPPMPFSATFLPNTEWERMTIVPEHRNTGNSTRLSIPAGVTIISMVTNSPQQFDLRHAIPGMGTAVVGSIPSGGEYMNKPVIVTLSAADANTSIEVHMQRPATVHETTTSMMVGVTVINTPPLG